MKGEHLFSKSTENLAKTERNIKIEHFTRLTHTGNGAVERSIHQEDGVSLTESVNRASRLMRFTLHTGLKLTPFGLHHGRKPSRKRRNLSEKSALPRRTGRKVRPVGWNPSGHPKWTIENCPEQKAGRYRYRR